LEKNNRVRAASVFYLAAGLPPLLAAGLLFLTPLSFLLSTARNSTRLVDVLALVFGLVLGPLLAWQQIAPDLLWTGVIGGTLAYGIHRVHRARSAARVQP